MRRLITRTLSSVAHLAVITAVLCCPATAQTVANGSFETGTPGYGAPTGWNGSYHFHTGIALPNRDGWFDNGWSPDGGRVGFIQTDGKATLGQQIAGFKANTVYLLVYHENSRAATAVPMLTVSLGAAVIYQAHAVPAVAKPGLFTTPFIKRMVSFTVPADGTYPLTFHFTSVSGDASLLIDNISIVKPASQVTTNTPEQPLGTGVKKAAKSRGVKIMSGLKQQSSPVSLKIEQHRGHQCLVFSNAKTALYLDASDFTLVDVKDVLQNISYVVKPGSRLFSARFKLSGAVSTANGAGARRCRYVLVKNDKSSSTLQLQFTGCPIGKSGLTSDAMVSITLRTDDPLLRFGLEILNYPSATVREIAFPTLTGLGSSVDGSERTDYLVAPGYPTFHTPRSTFRSVVPKLGVDATSTEYPGGFGVQVLSYNDGLGLGGLYLAAEDASYARKYFESTASKPHDSFMLKVVHYPDGSSANRSRKLPYQVAFGPIQGDWYDAAKIYRRQLLGQRKIKPISQRHDLPDWFLNNHVWYQGQDPKNGSDNMAAFTNRLEDIRAALGMPYAFHLYLWWKGSAMATGFPEYFPAVPGLGDTVSALRDKGVEIMPYIDMEMFDTTIPMWKAENAEKWASRSAKGGLNPVYTEVRPNVNMCESTPYWQHKVAACINTLVKEYGVRSVYLDELQYHPPLCYAKNHAHADIGGSYLADGFRTIITKAKAECGLPDLVLTGEHSSETYADLVSGGLVWASVFTDVMPMYEAILKDCTVPFGMMMMSTDLANMDSFAGKIGFQLVGGRQLGWINLDQGDLLGSAFARQMALLKLAAQCRAAAKPFLLFGEYMRPPDLSSAGMHTVGWSLAPINVVDPETKQVVGLQTIPNVMASAYKAPNGDIGIVLVNVTDSSIDLSVPVNESDWGLHPGKNYDISTWANGTWSKPSSVLLGSTLTSTMPPYTPIVIQLHDANSSK